MTEFLDDREPVERAEPDRLVGTDGAQALFGEYAVLSPGVEIVLDGRPVTAPIGE